MMMGSVMVSLFIWRLFTGKNGLKRVIISVGRYDMFLCGCLKGGILRLLTPSSPLFTATPHSRMGAALPVIIKDQEKFLEISGQLVSNTL